MSDCGYIMLHRSVWDHHLFSGREFGELEAWLWMVSFAAWKPTKVRVGCKMVTLNRGDLSFSERFLAEKWQWSKTRVHRFLALLESENMIALNSDHGLNQITICNYDKYQAPWTDERTINGPETDQKRTKEEKDNNLKKDIRGASAPSAEKPSRKKPARPMPDIFPMSEVMRAYAEKRGFRYELPTSFTNFQRKPGPAQEMFEAFKNHHVAKGSLFADWEAAWRTWVDNQARWNAERPQPRKSAL